MRSLSIDPVSGLDVQSSEFRRRAPRVQLSDDPDTATVQTVQEMCRQINQAARDPLVANWARNAVRIFRGGPGWAGVKLEKIDHQFLRDHYLADSCFWACKHCLKFTHHSRMFEVWADDLGDPRNKLQLLIAPDVLVRMNRMEGDCAIYTMLLCAMLKSLGVDYQICPAAVDHSQPDIFTHVFARCAGESLDASHGKYPGWQVPPEDLLRLWVFNSSGQQVEDQPKFSGLHVYRQSYGRRGLRGLSGPGGRGIGGPGGRGLGAMICDDTGCYDDGTGTGPTQTQELPAFGPLCPSGMIQSGSSCSFPAGGAATPPFLDTTGNPYSGPVYTAPSQSSQQWAQFATALLKAGMTQAAIQSIQPGTVVSANGAILRQNPGYSVPVGSTISANLGSSPSILYIGAALVGILIVGSMFKGGR